MNLYTVSEPPGQLLLTVRPETRTLSLIGLPILCGVLLIVAGIGGVLVLRYMPGAWPVPAVIILALLGYSAVTARDYLGQRALAASGEVYRFDRSRDTFTHNGVVLALLSQIESVQVRQFTTRGWTKYRLHLLLGDGSEVYVPEANDEREVESIASVIGKYLGLRVTHDALN